MGQTVAFIGLGIMGGRMVKNVLKAGYAVRAQNRTAAKAEALKPLGATVATTPRKAAIGAPAGIAGFVALCMVVCIFGSLASLRRFLRL